MDLAHEIIRKGYLTRSQMVKSAALLYGTEELERIKRFWLCVLKRQFKG